MPSLPSLAVILKSRDRRQLGADDTNDGISATSEVPDDPLFPPDVFVALVGRLNVCMNAVTAVTAPQLIAGQQVAL